MIRTALISLVALAALAGPAMAFEVQSAPAPRADAPRFYNGGAILRMMPAVASEAFRFGPSDEAKAKGATVVYELKGGKPADQIDVTNPRDNPFMLQPERRSERTPQAAR